MREIALDTETTGLDPFTGHRIVEIGAVEMMNHVRTGDHFHIYLNPQRDMPREAEQVHGLSIDFLRDKPLFRDIADGFIEFLQDSTLVIHNAQFDMKFINAELERLGYPALPMSRTLDTVQMARKRFPGQPANLDALCRRFSIDLSARGKHGALLDAELLADVYLELRGGRQAGLALQTAAEQTETVIRENTEQLEARDFPLSEREKQAHRALLEKMEGALWQQYS